MIFRIIMWLSIIWLAPLVCFILKNETKFKKNIVVGVTFPYCGRDDEQVKARLGRLKIQLTWVCVFLLASAVPCIFAESFSLTMILWCVWIDLCVVLPFIPFALCNRDLKKIKHERGWMQTGSETVSVDTALIPSYRWISPWLFALPLLMCLLPLLWDRSLWFIYAADAICVIIFWLCYRYLYRNKSEKVDENSELTETLGRVRRRNWGTVWIASSYCFALLNFGLLFTRNQPVLMMIVMFLITFIIVFLVLRVEFKTRKIQEKLTVHSGRGSYVDDDDKWIWGIFYYNPKDSKLFINSRVGINVSPNLAKPTGRILLGLVALILIAVPFTGPIIESATNRPINLLITETDVLASIGGTKYEIALVDISQAELLEALPDKMIRTVGTGTEKLLKGRFSAASIGNMLVCLDPTCPPFILITTDTGRHYLFGSRSPEQTETIFELIKQKTT